ncbi:5076_t:CDS:2 [Acaulospora colombiana]|uniref:5076_t:CDS:1 n=1 Tax=Acaulospora colombiana TaxID=27376 RepID=A0ACA9NR56_9GLOM|nr:5076_t:CDS:2 [Acaulospora colombiana]
MIPASSHLHQSLHFVPFRSVDDNNTQGGGTNDLPLYHTALSHPQPFFGQPIGFLQQVPNTFTYEKDEDVEMEDNYHGYSEVPLPCDSTKVPNARPTASGLHPPSPPFKSSGHNVQADTTNDKYSPPSHSLDPKENNNHKIDETHPILESSTFKTPNPQSMVGQLRPANFEDSSDEDEEEEWMRTQISLGRIFEFDLSTSSTDKPPPPVAPKAAKVVWNRELDRKIIALPIRRHSRLPENFIPVKSSVPSYPFTHSTAKFIESPSPLIHDVPPESYEEHQYVYTPQDDQLSRC